MTLFSSGSSKDFSCSMTSGGSARNSAWKTRELLDAVLFVFGFLVFVFVAGRGPFGFEHASDFVEGEFHALTVLVDEAADLVCMTAPS